MIHKLNRTEKNLWTSILWGAAVSVMVTMIGSGIIAALIMGERIKETSIGYGIIPTIIVASYAGSYIGCKLTEKKRLVVSLVTGSVYLGLLFLMTAILFGGIYEAIGETVLLILCGSVLCAMWTSRGKTGQKGKKRKIPNR